MVLLVEIPVGGRLNHFLQQWCELPDLDPWVLLVIQDGYKIPIAAPPPLLHLQKMPPLRSEASTLVEKMIIEFLDKGLIQRVDLGIPGILLKTLLHSEEELRVEADPQSDNSLHENGNSSISQKLTLLT